MSSSLPKGFFDDDRRQIAAEGVSLHDQEKLLEKNLRDEVKGFFNEINDGSIADLAAKEEENELLEKETEEEGVQLAYMAKLAVLMHKAGKKKSAGSSSSSISDDIKEQADKLIASITADGAADDESEGSKSHSQSRNDSKIYSDLTQILQRKRSEDVASKKRKAEKDITDTAGSYIPLSY